MLLYPCDNYKTIKDLRNPSIWKTGTSLRRYLHKAGWECDGATNAADGDQLVF